jgi:hypothetical protein
MSFTDAPDVSARDPRVTAVAAWVAAVTLCLSIGTAGLSFDGIRALLQGVFWETLSVSWPSWLSLGARVCAVVALVLGRRRLTAGAAVLLMGTILAGLWRYGVQGANPDNAGAWASMLVFALGDIVLLAALGQLVRDGAYWRQALAPGTWWHWLFYIALPAGLLHFATVLGGGGLLLEHGQPAYTPVLQLAGLIGATGLYRLAAGTATPRYVAALGFAVVLAAQLPEIALATHQIADLTNTPATTAIVLAALGLVIAAVLVTGLRAARRSVHAGHGAPR